MCNRILACRCLQAGVDRLIPERLSELERLSGSKKLCIKSTSQHMGGEDE
jgi:hypothetical protein